MGERKRLRIARCIYSGNEYYYDIHAKFWNAERQEKLNLRFMQEKCKCKRCVADREERERLIAALKRDNDTRGLELLGAK